MPGANGNAGTTIARADLGAAYNLTVDGVFNVLALQFGPNQTGNVNSNFINAAAYGNAQILLTPGTGSNGSIAANNGRTTLYVQNAAGGPFTHTLRSEVFLGGGASGVAVNHVWEIQGSHTVSVTGKILATSASRNTLTKAGTGTLLMSSNNAGSWTGGLIVDGGTVLANNTVSATGTGNIVVNGGGTFGGGGRVALGALPNGTPTLVTVNGGGTLRGGSSATAPTLTIAGGSSTDNSLVMNPGSVLGVKLFGTGATQISNVALPTGQGIAHINTNRIDLDLGGVDAAQLRADVGIGNSRSYRILTVADPGQLTTPNGGAFFNQAGFNVTNYGGFGENEWTFETFSLGTATAPGFVSVRYTAMTPVPEPHAVLAVVAVAGGVGAWRRKKKGPETGAGVA